MRIYRQGYVFLFGPSYSLIRRVSYILQHLELDLLDLLMAVMEDVDHGWEGVDDEEEQVIS